MITDIKKLKKIDDILNSEGTILGLYQLNNQLFLCSFLTDKTGIVYYSTTKEILTQYFNSLITLEQVYLSSKDFFVSLKFRNDAAIYLNQDLADKIQFGEKYYNELAECLKNLKMPDHINGI